MVQNNFMALPDLFEIEKNLKKNNTQRFIANLLYAFFGSFALVFLLIFSALRVIYLNYSVEAALQESIFILIISHFVFWLCVYVPLNLISKFTFAKAIKKETYNPESTIEKAAALAKNPSAYPYLIFARAVNRGGSGKGRALLGEILQIVSIAILHVGVLLLCLPAVASQSEEAPALIFASVILLVAPCFILVIKDKKLDQPNLREALDEINAEAQKDRG